MLTIRLSRVGKKKQATFKVIVSEKAKDTIGDYLELLGYYNPHANTVELKTDRLKYWLSKGAQTSGTVHNLLVDKKIITGEKVKVANIKKKSAQGGSASGGEADKPTAQPVSTEKQTEVPAPAPEEKNPPTNTNQVKGESASGGEEPKAQAEEKKEEKTV